MARNLRRAKIIELVRDSQIETQEELCTLLNGFGFNTTQATVSRDVKELGLIKKLNSQKKYVYSYTEKDDFVPRVKNLFRETVTSIRRAKNLVLVKTLSGGGSSAGMCVDEFNFEEVLGSVAGDDTLLIVTDKDEHAQEITKKLQDLLV